MQKSNTSGRKLISLLKKGFLGTLMVLGAFYTGILLFDGIHTQTEQLKDNHEVVQQKLNPGQKAPSADTGQSLEKSIRYLMDRQDGQSGTDSIPTINFNWHKVSNHLPSISLLIPGIYSLL